MRVVVFGSRDWDDYHMLGVVLNGFNHAYEDLTIIGGKARGADEMGERFYQRNVRPGLTFEAFPARWNEHDTEGSSLVPCQCVNTDGTCKVAGVRRNAEMAAASPDYGICAKDGFDHTLRKGGSEDMYRRLTRIGVPVMVLSHGPAVSQ